MKKAVLISILCLPLLVGCSIFDNFRKPDPTRVVEIPATALQGCDPIPARSGEDTADHHIRTILMYGICASKQDASIEIIKKLANKE